MIMKDAHAVYMYTSTYNTDTSRYLVVSSGNKVHSQFNSGTCTCTAEYSSVLI